MTSMPDEDAEGEGERRCCISRSGVSKPEEDGVPALAVEERVVEHGAGGNGEGVKGEEAAGWWSRAGSLEERA